MFDSNSDLVAYIGITILKEVCEMIEGWSDCQAFYVEKPEKSTLIFESQQLRINLMKMISNRFWKKPHQLETYFVARSCHP